MNKQMHVQMLALYFSNQIKFSAEANEIAYL